MADQPQQKVRKPLAVPIYILVDEDALILPSAKVEIVRPSQLPTQGSYYVLTSEGLQVRKDTNIVNALVPVQSLPVLASFSQAARLRLPKIPPLILARAHAFFQAVWNKYQAESEVMLLYNAQEKQYDLWCPQQTVSHVSVNYTMSSELANTPTDWQWVGTIHSHCNFSAYHSGTDIDDEKNADGVHITLGHVDTKYPSFSACICIGKQRWPVPPENICIGVESSGGGSVGYYVNTKSDQHVKITLNEEEEALLHGACSQQVVREWMPRVQKGWTNQNSYQSVVWTREDVVEGDDEDGEWVFHQGRWSFFSQEDLVAHSKQKQLSLPEATVVQAEVVPDTPVSKVEGKDDHERDSSES